MDAGVCLSSPIPAFLNILTHSHTLRRVFLSTLGIRDTSGMRLYYTSHLRKYDMGVLQLGISVFPIHFIPPGAEAFLSYGLCKTDKFEEVKLRCM